ncbi:hypothetical protein LCGC14_1497010, partial [marine sediment metagenome]
MSMVKDWNEFIEFMNTVKEPAVFSNIAVDNMIEVYKIAKSQGYFSFEPNIKKAAIN